MKSEDELHMADEITRLRNEVKIWQRRYRWMSARFVAASALVFIGMFLVRAWYSAENRREIVCAKDVPVQEPGWCADRVFQDYNQFSYVCPHPDHQMTVQTVACPLNNVYQLVKCACRRP